jgi:hypothetical protein
MGRLRRLVYSVTVALLVFAFLAVPVLSRLYGPVVYLPVYAFVSIVAGGVTWSLLHRLAQTETESGARSVREREDLEEVDVTAQEVDVDAELDQLKNQE